MAIRSESTPRGADCGERAIRIAATGDIHVGREGDQERWTAAFAGLRGRVDLVLLAGDLTTHGRPEQGAMVAAAVQGLDVPIVAVLGNHDWHADRHDELVAVLQEGGIDVLVREHRVLELCGTAVGIAATKGFGGGFHGAHVADFGEPLMRRLYAESTEEARALDAGLRAIAPCPFRIALLHYAPITETLRGERAEIWPFLGTDRLAAPLREHGPDLVLHGHAHAGTFEGRLGDVPVFNVSVPVMGEDFWVFEMTGAPSMPLVRTTSAPASAAGRTPTPSRSLRGSPIRP
ncbi:MAG TPA: metallophosphoesterase [Solirubrobacteraceae bacterium]|nr:metallophosphoesterase [Solirubrobacteraceae bacterium]